MDKSASLFDYIDDWIIDRVCAFLLWSDIKRLASTCSRMYKLSREGILREYLHAHSSQSRAQDRSHDIVPRTDYLNLFAQSIESGNTRAFRATLREVLREGPRVCAAIMYRSCDRVLNSRNEDIIALFFRAAAERRLIFGSSESPILTKYIELKFIRKIDPHICDDIKACSDFHENLVIEREFEHMMSLCERIARDDNYCFLDEPRKINQDDDDSDDNSDDNSDDDTSYVDRRRCRFLLGIQSYYANSETWARCLTYPVALNTTFVNHLERAKRDKLYYPKAIEYMIQHHMWIHHTLFVLLNAYHLGLPLDPLFDLKFARVELRSQLCPIYVQEQHVPYYMTSARPYIYIAHRLKMEDKYIARNLIMYGFVEDAYDVFPPSRYFKLKWYELIIRERSHNAIYRSKIIKLYVSIHDNANFRLFITNHLDMTIKPQLIKSILVYHALFYDCNIDPLGRITTPNFNVITALRDIYQHVMPGIPIEPLMRKKIEMISYEYDESIDPRKIYCQSYMIGSERLREFQRLDDLAYRSC